MAHHPSPVYLQGTACSQIVQHEKRTKGVLKVYKRRCIDPISIYESACLEHGCSRICCVVDCVQNCPCFSDSRCRKHGTTCIVCLQPNTTKPTRLVTIKSHTFGLGTFVRHKFNLNDVCNGCRALRPVCAGCKIVHSPSDMSAANPSMCFRCAELISRRLLVPECRCAKPDAVHKCSCCDQGYAYSSCSADYQYLCGGCFKTAAIGLMTEHTTMCLDVCRMVADFLGIA